MKIHPIKSLFQLLLFVSHLVLFAGCAAKTAQKEPAKDLYFQPVRTTAPLISIHFIDRNAMSETITAKERLKTYQHVDFLSAQAYQKVLRVFEKDKDGSSLSLITSYHANGQLKQYLEVLNGRANGIYSEWHINGLKKLVAKVVAGAADIDEKSQLTWSFDGTSYAWNEEGQLITEIPYEKGELHGVARYFYGQNLQGLSAPKLLSQEIPYTKGEIDGTLRRFTPEGAVLEESHFTGGVATGVSRGFWTKDQPQWDEKYTNGLLEEGSYFAKDGRPLCHINQGRGKKAIFTETGALELHEYIDGIPEGLVQIHDDSGHLTSSYCIKNGLKHGEEIIYYPQKPFATLTGDGKVVQKLSAKLSIVWYEGKIHGTSKSWYDNGAQESQKEMVDNKKHGMLTVWYRDKSLMLMEEYEKDKLVRGEYHKKDESSPISKVAAGKGIATLFDSEGHFSKKIRYAEGKPLDDHLQ